jgi:hypothetical protein
MQKIELKDLVNYIDANYSILDGKTPEQIKLIMWTWYEVLKDYDVKDVRKSIADYICNNSNKPKPSHIIEQLRVNRANKHFIHNQITHSNDCDSEKILNRTTFMDMMKKEYQPHLTMNLQSLPQDISDRLYASRDSLSNFYDKVWGMIISTSMTVLHLELCLNSVRGQPIEFEPFMRCLVKSDDIIESFEKNIDIEKSNAMDYLNSLKHEL